MRRLGSILALLTLALGVGCTTPVAVEKVRVLEANLAEATAVAERAPLDENARIWVGRRLGYLGRYNDAVIEFTIGLQTHPNSARLLRFRGHRWITLRRFDAAIADLERAREIARSMADEVEPDGDPNAAGIPRSTLKGNILYHLGLAYYVQGDFAQATKIFREDDSVATNDDSRVATRYWLFLALARSGDVVAAQEVLAGITPTMTVIENFGYHRLLLYYKGAIGEAEVAGPAGSSDVQVDQATLGYGLAVWELLRGNAVRANHKFKELAETGMWAAFGVIAAEAELTRE